MMKYRYLLHVHDESVTYKFPAYQDIRQQGVDHKRFPAWISGNPGST